jgi:flagellar basal-body rod modification protein FlgD
MTDINGVINALAPPPPSGPSAKGTNLGKDDFLKLFVAQLQHQDPMNPTDDKDFMGQMAQFSSLEQMTNVSSSLDQLTLTSQLTQGAALFGQQLTYQLDGDSQVESGTASAVRVENGKVLVTIGGTDVPLAAIQTVTPPAAGAAS